MDDGKVHEKRFVVVRVEGKTATLVINSEISGFIRARAHMMKCQVQIDAAAHPFMDYDSHIDCSRAREYPTDEIVDQLVRNANWVLGRISIDMGREVVAAIKASATISPAQATELCASLSTELGLLACISN